MKIGVIGLGNNEIQQVIARNKKAYHDYFVLDTYEAGIELYGTEIKSIRNGRVNLKDSFCSVDDGEMFAIGMHVSPYEQGNIFNRDPMRKKRLLLHKREIMKLFGQSQQQGLSIVPLQLYLKNGRAKLEIGLCKGKKLHDKREVAAKRDAQRMIEREFKERY
ncbi:MAG: SsrA-binding protein SmpB [Eubacterium sp.]|nr:SsrA-binding protein SmpB [Eubacterium sp.]